MKINQFLIYAIVCITIVCLVSCSDKPNEMSSYFYSSDSETQKESSKLETQKESSKLETQKESSKLETQKESSKLETQKESSKLETQKESSKLETQKESEASSSLIISPTQSPSFFDGKHIIGGVVSDYLARKHFGNHWDEVDPLKALHDHGMNWVRVGVTMQNTPVLKSLPLNEWRSLGWRAEFWSSREYAEQILVEAQELGMKKSLFLFLSPEAAHGDAQKAPLEWRNKSVDEIAVLLEKYTFTKTRYYINNGIKIDLYEIGNEIERGILEFRPLERIHLPQGINILTNTEWMRNNVWNVNAKLLKAAISGIKRADPNAIICLHAAGVGYSPGELLVTGFFKAMIDFGVDYDIAGLSYYWNMPETQTPRAPYFTHRTFNALVGYLGETLGKKVIISEWAYPRSTAGTENKIEDMGYPFTPNGQAKWTRDFLRFCYENENILGSFYFYPEYYDGFSNGSTIFLESCGLFVNQHTPAPALLEYKKFSEDYIKKGK